MKWSELVLAGLAWNALTGAATGQDVADLNVGHWVTAKGVYEGDYTILASEIEISPPREEQVMRGKVDRVADQVFWVLDQQIEFSEKTRWRGVTLEELASARVEVEGYYRGLRKFSARTISSRESGRERVAGRIDEIRARSDGGVELTIMRYTVVVPPDTEVELEDADDLDEISLAPEVIFNVPGLELDERDDDDDVPQSFRLSENLSAGLQLEWRADDERELDLDADDDEDRLDNRFGVRAELLYRPEGNFTGFLGVRHSLRLRDDDEDGYEQDSSFRIAEAYGLWTDVLPNWDVQIGRQDFDESREWLYDANLDALRLRWRGDDMHLELSASTVISDGNDAEEATDNFIAYLSSADEDRHWGAYVIDRRDRRSPRDYPFFAGLRAIGEWLPRNEVWAELATVQGYSGSDELDGYAFDLGTTWKPRALEPWYFSAGFALGSGDDDPDDRVDEAFRQTGLHDNNDKFGGVTSFRYYGELTDPDLSNLQVATLGIGRRFGRRNSLDLVWHGYRQDEAADRWRRTGIDRRPDGVHPDLGQELDLIWGTRSEAGWQLELVLATFDPGDAFPDDSERAWLGKIQLRYRF